MKNDPEVPAREPEDRQKQNNMLLQVFKSGEFSVLSFNFEIRKLPKLKNSPSEWDYSYKTGRELAEMSKEELMDRLSFLNSISGTCSDVIASEVHEELVWILQRRCFK